MTAPITTRFGHTVPAEHLEAHAAAARETTSRCLPGMVRIVGQLMLDKPIILVVAPGARIPDRLRRIADELVETGPDGRLAGEDFEVRFRAALDRVFARLEARKDGR